MYGLTICVRHAKIWRVHREREKKTHFGLSISTIFQTCNAGEVNLVNVTIEIIFAAGRFLGFFFKTQLRMYYKYIT